MTELSKKYKEKTVILIDEYESSILEHINNKEKAEELTNLGRSDLVIDFDERIYLFEIKMDKSAIDAINQIKEKKYYEKYSGKEIYIIGINIDSEKRNIEDYIIEKI
nr:PD-(D/E)XK nuclease domain-containing protein [Marinitoga sp. 1197]